MATLNPIVSGLTAYVDDQANKDQLISKAVLGANSTAYMNLNTGVKGKTNIHIMNTDVQLQDGSTCGWSEAGSTDFSEKMIDPKYFKVNMAFCEKKLLSTYLNYAVKMAATENALPFEQYWLDEITKGINKQIDTMIWQGTGSGVQFKGLVPQMLADGAVVKVTRTEGTSAYEAIKAVYAKMKEEIILSGDAMIYVSPAIFRAFIQDLVAANLYHTNATDVDGIYKIPGTNINVVAINGLVGSNAIVAARQSNLYYGCDLESDKEVFDLWFSQDNRETRLAVEFNAGVAYAFADEIVISTIQ